MSPRYWLFCNRSGRKKRGSGTQTGCRSPCTQVGGACLAPGADIKALTGRTLKVPSVASSQCGTVITSQFCPWREFASIDLLFFYSRRFEKKRGWDDWGVAPHTSVQTREIVRCKIKNSNHGGSCKYLWLGRHPQWHSLIHLWFGAPVSYVLPSFSSTIFRISDLSWRANIFWRMFWRANIS